MDITLNDGRVVFLDSLYQYRTYSGLLCGVPDEELNQRNIQHALLYALEQMHPNTSYLVPPPSLELDNVDKRIKRYQDVIRLPYITCFGVFNSKMINGDKENDGSWLTVVWYQDRFALPIEESVIEYIKTIDWDKEAEGYQF